MALARQKILAHLKKVRSASAREIARALKMSTPNARHHLSVLCSDGRVELTAVNNREARGRPEKMYSLSQAALGDNLSALTNALLDVASSKLAQSEAEGLKIEALANRLLDSSQFANLPIQKRLVLLVEKLNEMHYQARWEAGAEGPRVIFGRCPYSRVIAGHPELCKLDTFILESSLARPVERFVKAEIRSSSLCPYLFRVH